MVPYKLSWILCKWNVLLQTCRHIHYTLYTTKMCHYDEKIKKFTQKLTPISFQAGFRRNCELRLGTCHGLHHIYCYDNKYLFALFLFILLPVGLLFPDLFYYYVMHVNACMFSLLTPMRL